MFYLGINVSKAKLDCLLLYTSSNSANPKARRKSADLPMGIKNKTGAADSAVLACYEATKNPPPWQPPPTHMR